ncbi:MAG: hypothetical protein CVT49_12620 [candidate division Zixibacteria bacterium HGW-Zixibacteria-1]|nr:MAG: hypothetical protein CVT49_12620 [candidate division Zixibacteria bacterium HGW-Zixibacteria-1]
MNNFWRKRTFLLIAICLLFPLSGSSQESNATMQFYLDNASYVFNQNYLFNSTASFSFELRSIYHETDYRGEIKKIDTAVYLFHFADGKLDSMNVIDSTSMDKNTPPDSSMPFLPWNDSLNFYFYPNDTGAGRLAVGFESPVEDSIRARSGFMNINREDFSLETVFLHRRDEEGINRQSFDYYFERVDNVIRPTRFETYSLKIAILGRQYTRHIYEFFDYKLETR